MSENKTIAKRIENEYLTSAMTVDDVVAQVGMIGQAMSRVMKKDEDYGIIPGTDKPSLWKPGAEKLCMMFRLAPSFESTMDYDGDHLTVKSRCILTHIPTGRTIGTGEAICSTKEKKYAKRKENGKIVPNANLADSYNTVVKMANKRALVAATLVATAASTIFTQDMADEPIVVPETEAKFHDKELQKAYEETKPILDAHAAKVKEAASDGLTGWQGKIAKVEAQELPGGRPCWTLITEEGLEFKTLDEAHSHVNGGTVEIRYETNSKGSRVIKKIREVSHE